MEKTHFLSVNFKILNPFGVFPSYYKLFFEKDKEIQDGRSYYYLIIILLLTLFRPGFFRSCRTGAGGGGWGGFYPHLTTPRILKL